MKRVFLLHGPNLNMLGKRDPAHYGSMTLDELIEEVEGWAKERGFELAHLQSNHEGALIDALQQAREWACGALLNAGALTHTSRALHEALLDFAKPVIEVHLSKISEREEWRRESVLRPACAGFVEGLGAEGYRVALEKLSEVLDS